MSRDQLLITLTLCLICGLLCGPLPAAAGDGDRTFTLTLGIDPPGGGTLSPGPGEHSFSADELVTISIDPAVGYRFVRWEGAVDDPHDRSTTVTVAGDIVITAIVAQDVRMLTVSVSGSGEVTQDPAGPEYGTGEVVQLTASPEPGWTFSHWLGPVSDSQSPETTVTMDADRTVLAVFEPEATEIVVVEVPQIVPGESRTDLPRTGGDEIAAAVGLGGVMLVLGLFLRKRS